MKTHELAKQLLDNPDVNIGIIVGVEGDHALLAPFSVNYHKDGELAVIDPILPKDMEDDGEGGDTPPPNAFANAPTDVEVPLNEGVNERVIERLFSEFELKRAEQIKEEFDADTSPEKKRLAQRLAEELVTGSKLGTLKEKTGQEPNAVFWGYALEAYTHHLLKERSNKKK
jgi:hypothetical protein